MKTVILAALLALSTLAHAEEWSTPDKALLAAVEAAYLIDWRQTRQIAAAPERYHEKNVMLGDHPTARKVNLYFAGAAIGTYVIADLLPSPYRQLFLGGALALTISVIDNNRKIGLQVRFF